WEYDADAMKKQIEKLEDIRDKKLWKMKQAAEAVTGITSPADDEVSTEYTKIANRSGESHNEQFKKYQKYLDSYINTLYDIDKIYQNEDDEAAQELLSKEI